MNWNDVEMEMTISASKIFMLRSKIQSIVNELSGKEEEEYVIKNNFSTITLLCITINVSVSSDKTHTVMQLKRAVGALLREQAKFYKKFHHRN